MGGWGKGSKGGMQGQSSTISGDVVVVVPFGVVLGPPDITVVLVGQATGKQALGAFLGVLGEDALEGLPELCVEDAVYDGVEGRVGVAQPGEDLEGRGGYAILADAEDDVDDKEGGPAEQEDPHDDADGDGRLVLLQQRGL